MELNPNFSAKVALEIISSKEDHEILYPNFVLNLHP
jgi:hypothetical protein